MERIDRILNHDLFKYHLAENRKAEENRKFGKHDLTHFLDVARIGEIINLESGLGISREWIYAAALLHDLGRHIQYEDETPHELASVEIAPEILRECGFDDSETHVIIDAIKSHRDAAVAAEENLRGVLYRADKASRTCFACDVEPECHRSDDKKNLKIRY
ncbi:MAG: HD domain-containing protein [Muribaculum sp.]|nr:HD domain-containing protein [Muribaculum sp.]